MVMTQDTLDKTRSEFSYVFSRSAHHFSLPLLIRIHQARDNLSLFLFFLVPSSFIPNFSIKKEIIVVSLFFFPNTAALLKKISRVVVFILSEKRNSIDRDRGSRVLDSANYASKISGSRVA